MTEEESIESTQAPIPSPYWSLSAGPASPRPSSSSSAWEPASKEDKVVCAGPGGAVPAQPPRGQDVGRPGGTDALAFQSVVLTLALHEGEDGVLLSGRGQSLANTMGDA